MADFVGMRMVIRYRLIKPLRVKPDGLVVRGNTRIKVLQ